MEKERMFQGIVALGLLFPVAVVAVAAPYGGGNGSTRDPYQIWTAEQMNAIGANPQDWGMHFKLMADIDLAGFDGKNRRPAYNIIGPDTLPGTWEYDGTPFQGVFDGNGHRISHLTIVGARYLGLFGMVGSGGEVKNLGLVAVDISGSSDDVGAVAGGNGDLQMRSIQPGTLSACYSTGKIAGASCVGGLVGRNYGTVTACYSAAQVTGTGWVGGLVGSNDAGHVTDSYSVGAVTCPGGWLVGGLVGFSPGVVLRCVWDIQTSRQLTSAGGVGLTTTEMMNPYTLGVNGFAGNPKWVLNAGHDYPRLVWENSPGVPIPQPGIDWLEGQGTPEAPYRLDKASQLVLLGKTSLLWDKHLVLTADIDMGADPQNRPSFPGAVIPVFAGVVNGNGHSISHLTIKGGGYLGLVGQLRSGATIKNLLVTDASITGSDGYVGALVGFSNGAVTRCGSTGEVRGRDSVGGVVGRSDASVNQCYSTCTVTGAGGSVGGLVGESMLGRVTQCYSTGAVNGQARVGGLAGFIQYGEVAECYSAGAVRGQSLSGGLIGHNENGSIGTSFWDMQTSGYRASAGGTGKTTAQMQTITTFRAWDFQGIWKMRAGLDYPKLKWEVNPVPVATTIEKVSGDNQQAIIGSKPALALTVCVRDEYGQAMANAQVAFTVTAGGGMVEPASAVTDAGGRASTILTLGPTPGLTHVQAAVGSLSVDFTIEAMPLPVATAIEKVSGDNQQAIVGSRPPLPLTVRVKDQYGKAVAKVQVTFTITAGGGEVEPGSVVTDAAGLASTILTVGSTPGTTRVRAAAGTLSVDFTVEATPLPTPTIMEKVSGDNQQAIVGAKPLLPLTVRVKDQYGMAVANVPVTFTVTAGGGSVAPASTMTDAGGLASTILTVGSTPGTIRVRAAAGNLSVDFTVEATPLPTPTTMEKVSGDNQQAAVGSQPALPLTVRVKDQYGKAMASIQVTFTITAGGGTVAPALALTDTGGLASTVLTLGPTPGTTRVRAAVGNLTVDFAITGLVSGPDGPGGGLSLLASAFIDATGKVMSGTPNVLCTLTSSWKYEITIVGETYTA
ncbi:MAG: Ig-like domain-containing protein, partial [Planctomycetes bacterium]|nr:Ig-like domain-containing protein [Planctomycetota bacterium]